MRRPLLRAAALACAIAPLAVAPAPAPAALETIVQDDAVMLYSSADDLRAAAARLKLLGVDRVRITANWSVMTRDSSSKVKPAFDARDPAAYEQARWTNLDNAVRAVTEAGMRVLIDIGFWAPHWATRSGPGPKARTQIKARHYADFAVALVRRYTGKFVLPSAALRPPPPPAQDDNPFQEILIPFFPPRPRVPSPLPVTERAQPLPRVNVFALWNEPNHPGLMLPQWKADRRTPASPAIYRRMVRAAYPAIKRARNGTRVLIGNTSSVGGNPGT
ncbi:MAG: hypothetical protein ACRDKY_10015, partial [Solirubrobacteraceae bacterium]